MAGLDAVAAGPDTGRVTTLELFLDLVFVWHLPMLLGIVTIAAAEQRALTHPFRVGELVGGSRAAINGGRYDASRASATPSTGTARVRAKLVQPTTTRMGRVVCVPCSRISRCRRGP